MEFSSLAVNQLINHIDKINDISDGEFDPRIIIRQLLDPSVLLTRNLNTLEILQNFLKKVVKI